MSPLQWTKLSVGKNFVLIKLTKYQELLHIINVNGATGFTSLYHESIQIQVIIITFPCFAACVSDDDCFNMATCDVTEERCICLPDYMGPKCGAMGMK